MYCDRKSTDIHKSQAGFIKNIAMPLYLELNRIIEWSNIEEICLSQMKRNILYWEKRNFMGRNSTVIDCDIDLTRLESRRVTLPIARIV